MGLHSGYESLLASGTVDSQYLRSIAAANGNYTMTTAGTYTTRPFRTFMSDGSLVVTELKAKKVSVDDAKATGETVTTRVIDSTTNALPAGPLYTMGDGWIFTSITTSAGIVTLNF